MAKTLYLGLTIAGTEVQVEQLDKAPVSISYQLEDPQNFQEKGSATSFDITLPATVKNDRVFNNYRNPNRMDMSSGTKYRSLLPCTISAGGTELLKGVALLKTASNTATDGNYMLNCYGLNGDWAVQMQDWTLDDVVPDAITVFDINRIMLSWAHDGRSSDSMNFPWVYAPVRYRKPFGGDGGNDTDVKINDMRPSLFLYPMILKAFTRLGYRIQSTFFDTDYFRRMTLPWVWGDFMSINSKVSDMLLFKAVAGGVFNVSDGFLSAGRSNSGDVYGGAPHDISGNFTVSNDFQGDGFDNGGCYEYFPGPAYPGAMNWTYKTVYGSQLGTITARFSLHLNCIVSADWNSWAEIYVDVYKGNTLVQTQTLASAHASLMGNKTDDHRATPLVFNFSVADLNPGENVVLKLRWAYFKSATGDIEIVINHLDFPPSTYELVGVSIQPGGLVNWHQYEKFKSYAWLDLLRGVLDAFNITPQTDSITKTVYFEPAYPYSLAGGPLDGHFTSKRIDWSKKLDISKENKIELFSDADQNFTMKFKDDTNDGGFNNYKNRIGVEPGKAKYVFPDRFKTGEDNPYENRFFSPVLHYNAVQWQNLTGATPQLIALIPENVSNTSSDSGEEAAFAPKLAWYKGLCDRNVYGGWSFEGDNTHDLPYMFAVNYKAGGENDPVLTYCDQNINNVVAPGLMRKFFLQRLAIMRNGQLYSPNIFLNNNDVTNWLHREQIIINNGSYLLINIDKYMPLLSESTQCQMWKFWPVEQTDLDHCYPSQNTVHFIPASVTGNDIKYSPLILINTDIPK